MNLALVNERGLFFPPKTRLYEISHPDDGDAVLAIYSIGIDAWGMRRADGVLFYLRDGEVRNDLWFLGPEWASERDLIVNAIQPEGWSIKQEALVK